MNANGQLARPLPPQVPGAPAWKAKPKAGGAFAVAVLAAGIAAALLPSEGRKLESYRDSGGIWTVCMGLIGPVEQAHRGRRWTEDECKAAESAYIAPMVQEMQRCVPIAVQAEMTYGEWITYAHWAFNTGTRNFCNSTLGKRLADGNHNGACRAMAAWTYITLKGKKRNCRDPDMRKICSGIVTRRDNEVSWCLEALP